MNTIILSEIGQHWPHSFSGVMIQTVFFVQTSSSDSISRVHYCIPGINAINIHMKVVNSPMEGTGKKKALLEDAPSSNVYSQLQKLTSQNPVCEYHPSFVQIESSSSVFCGGISTQKHAFLFPSHYVPGKNILHFL